jgi:type II secretion system protein J
LTPADGRGFTLVEIMVGIIISSLIISAAYSAYLGANRAWEAARSSKRHHQHARVALGIMEQYLRAALAPDTEASIVFDGQDFSDEEAEGPASHTLRFASTGGPANAGPRTRSDLCEVEFYLSEATQTEPSSLMMRRSALPTGEWSEDLEGSDEEEEAIDSTEEALLASEVVEFAVRYFDGEEWIEEWYLATDLPVAVELTLVFSESAEESEEAVMDEEAPEAEVRTPGTKFMKMVVINTRSPSEPTETMTIDEPSTQDTPQDSEPNERPNETRQERREG